MARYYFDLQDGACRHVDDEGSDLAGIEEAVQEARHFLPDVAREQIPSAGDKRSFVVTVRDETGRHVYSATLDFAGMRLSLPDEFNP